MTQEPSDHFPTKTQLLMSFSALACASVLTTSVYDFWYPEGRSLPSSPWYVDAMALLSMTSTFCMNVCYYYWTGLNFQARAQQSYHHFKSGHIHYRDMVTIASAGILQILAMLSSCWITVQASPPALRYPVGFASIFLVGYEAMSRCNAVAEILVEFQLITPQCLQSLNSTQIADHTLYHQFFKRWLVITDNEKVMARRYLSNDDNNMVPDVPSANMFYKAPLACLPGIAVCFNYLMFYELDTVWPDNQQESQIIKIVLGLVLSAPSLLLTGLFLNDCLVQWQSLHAVLSRRHQNTWQANGLFALCVMVYASSFAGFTFLAQQCLKSPPYSAINNSLFSNAVLTSAALTSVLSNGYTASDLIVRWLEPDTKQQQAEIHRQLVNRLFQSESSHNLNEPLIKLNKQHDLSV